MSEQSSQPVAGYFLAHDNSDPPQLWVWRGEPNDESAEPWMRIEESDMIDKMATRIDELEKALREIKKLRWGYDGDCGAIAIVDRILD